MPVDERGAGAEELLPFGFELVGARLLTHTWSAAFAPTGEDRDAVATARDGVEVGEQRVPLEPLEDPLADLVGGSTSRITRVTAPSAPNPTTKPSKSSSPRSTVRSSPSEVTNSNPATAVAKLPLVSPEPCVAVATAPATEMCGSEARLCRASPWGASACASSP